MVVVLVIYLVFTSWLVCSSVITNMWPELISVWTQFDWASTEIPNKMSAKRTGVVGGGSCSYYGSILMDPWAAPLRCFGIWGVVFPSMCSDKDWRIHFRFLRNWKLRKTAAMKQTTCLLSRRDPIQPGNELPVLRLQRRDVEDSAAAVTGCYWMLEPASP